MASHFGPSLDATNAVFMAAHWIADGFAPGARMQIERARKALDDLEALLPPVDGRALDAAITSMPTPALEAALEAASEPPRQAMAPASYDTVFEAVR